MREDPPGTAPTATDVDRYRENLQGEIDGAALYDVMAAAGGTRRGPATHNATVHSTSAASTTGISGRYEPVVSKEIAPT